MHILIRIYCFHAKVFFKVLSWFGSENTIQSVILLPAHHASFALILSLGCKVFILASPRMQLYCRLVIKIVFWTHKFAVGLIDMGNSESEDL